MKMYGTGTDKIEFLTCVMTLFVLLFVKITTYAFIFSIPSYGWIRIRFFFGLRSIKKFRILSDSDPQHWTCFGFAYLFLIKE
jgi:hypothetical protein